MSERLPNELDPATRLSAAALRLTRERPYLAAAIWAMQRVVAPGLGTLAVDRRWRLYYDPAAVDSWSVEELAGVLYHEACHLLRNHAGRAATFDDRRRWNLAADAEINDDLRAEGVRLPGVPVEPAALGLPAGKLAEEYYLHLIPPAAAPSCPGWGTAGAGCGSAATGHPERWEIEDGGGEATGGQANPGLGDVEAAIVRRGVARSVRDRGTGTVPAHWQRWADELLEPRVDWRRELAGAIRTAMAATAGALDYTYRRPSRRQGCAGNAVLPALYRPEPRVAVVVDTSGSMVGELIEQALGEVGGILRAAGQREGVTVLAVDSAVHACRRVFRVSQVQLSGGGGTDMGAGLAAVEHLRPRPEVAVVLTDGFTPWPEKPSPRMRTIVVLLDPAGRAPSWARVIRMVA
ncbi:MAG: hypothetical protein HY331_12070 [Chloroflexi bacterium]|nr:hypothetical protein [Chloroflexota bacterium]